MVNLRAGDYGIYAAALNLIVHGEGQTLSPSIDDIEKGVYPEMKPLNFSPRVQIEAEKEGIIVAGENFVFCARARRRSTLVTKALSASAATKSGSAP